MKKVLSMGLIVAVSFLVGCGVSNSVEANDEVKFVSTYYRNGIGILKDTETGVNYIVYGNNNGKSICPRYNANGSLYVD